MNIFIFADMEGISGISGSEFVRTDGRLYQQGCRYYTMDINACVEGCFKAGADKVIVRDGHSSGNHVVWTDFDSRAELIQGNTKERLPGIKECAGLILLGYHAMAGAEEALLEHSYSSAAIQNLWMNDARVGEFGIDSAIAADYGVPTIMVSGDDKICAEAREWIPEMVCCQVKEGFSCQGAKLLSAGKAHKLIEEKTIEAIGKISSIAPPVVSHPVTIKRENIERGGVKNGYGIKQIDGRTYSFTAETVEEAFWAVI